MTLLLCLPLIALADPPPGYYGTVDTTDSTTLRTTLHAVIDDHTRFPYTSGSTDTWDILNLADEDPNDSGNILDVYRNASYPKISGGVRDYNREHTWPKSYGFPANTLGPYADCHHLFLCDGDYNGLFSNNPYRDCHAGCAERTTLANNDQGGGSGEYPGNSNWRTGTGSGETGFAEPDLILTDDQLVTHLPRIPTSAALAAGCSVDDNAWEQAMPLIDSRECRSCLD